MLVPHVLIKEFFHIFEHLDIFKLCYKIILSKTKKVTTLKNKKLKLFQKAQK